jgi:hypothetical protein
MQQNYPDRAIFLRTIFLNYAGTVRFLKFDFQLHSIGKAIRSPNHLLAMTCLASFSLAERRVYVPFPYIVASSFSPKIDSLGERNKDADILLVVVSFSFRISNNTTLWPFWLDLQSQS